MKKELRSGLQDHPHPLTLKKKNAHCLKRLRKKPTTTANLSSVPENSNTTQRNSQNMNQISNLSPKICNRIQNFERSDDPSESAHRAARTQFCTRILFITLFVSMFVVIAQACRYSTVDQRHTMCTFMPRQCPGKMLISKSGKREEDFINLAY